MCLMMFRWVRFGDAGSQDMVVKASIVLNEDLRPLV